jgi:cell division ATPase FtsA
VQEIYKKIEPFLNQRKNLPHIRVVGGISKMDGFVETVEEIFNMPVDMGAIRHTKDLHDISFACSLGLARHGLRNRLAKRSIQLDTNSPVGRFMSKIKGLLSEYF